MGDLDKAILFNIFIMKEGMVWQKTKTRKTVSLNLRRYIQKDESPDTGMILIAKINHYNKLQLMIRIPQFFILFTHLRACEFF